MVKNDLNFKTKSIINLLPLLHDQVCFIGISYIKQWNQKKVLVSVILPFDLVVDNKWTFRSQKRLNIFH